MFTHAQRGRRVTAPALTLKHPSKMRRAREDGVAKCET